MNYDVFRLPFSLEASGGSGGTVEEGATAVRRYKGTHRRAQGTSTSTLYLNTVRIGNPLQSLRAWGLEESGLERGGRRGQDFVFCILVYSLITVSRVASLFSEC